MAKESHSALTDRQHKVMIGICGSISVVFLGDDVETPTVEPVDHFLHVFVEVPRFTCIYIYIYIVEDNPQSAQNEQHIPRRF